MPMGFLSRRKTLSTHVTTVPGGSPRSSLAVGDILWYRQLGSLGTYRFVGRHDDLLELEVIEVPGLSPGLRFRFTAAAVARMETVSAAADAPGGCSAREPSPVEQAPAGVVERPSNA
jgi:hypothetical protein